MGFLIFCAVCLFALLSCVAQTRDVACHLAVVRLETTTTVKARNNAHPPCTRPGAACQHVWPV